MTGKSKELKRQLISKVNKSNVFSSVNDSTAVLFAFEGILLALIINLIINNNNLCAIRLGASDFQISLAVALPQFVGLLVLIPGGLLTDRMVNKRRMVILSLLFLSVFYIVLGFTPMMGKDRLTAFILLLALSYGPMTLYNASWQAYFSDAVPIENRNRIYTLRMIGTYVFNIATPLITGLILASTLVNEEKLRFHQIFFWISSVLLIVQVFVLRKIHTGERQTKNIIRLKDFFNTASELVHNKRFLMFTGVALFFYISWQCDWALYFIGQVKYLKLNEVWLSYANIGGSLMQLITLGFWSRMNEKFGVRFGIIIGSLSLSFFPFCMIISTSIHGGNGPLVFLLLNTLSNFAFPAIMLNMLQCLLQVTPEKNKTLYISIYTMFITLSNAVMPMVGVKVYTMLGSSLHALHETFLIIFVFRVTAAALWAIRWRLMRNEAVNY